MGRGAEPAVPRAGVVTTTDVDEATRGVAVAVMVGGFPRKAGMERKDVMAKNVSIYKSQASSLEKNAAPGVKVRVITLSVHLPRRGSSHAPRMPDRLQSTRRPARIVRVL